MRTRPASSGGCGKCGARWRTTTFFALPIQRPRPVTECQGMNDVARSGIAGEISEGAGVGTNRSRPDLYYGGRIFTADPEAPWVEALVVDGPLITFAGDLRAARAAAGPERQEVQLGGPLTLPGFVDGHAHLLMAGEAQ